MKLKSQTNITTEIYNEESGELVTRINWSTSPTQEGFPQDDVVKLFGKDFIEKVMPIIEMVEKELKDK